MAEAKRIDIGPQSGPQTKFLSMAADIVIYGGAAGGGKTFSLLCEPLRHIENGLFSGVIFRRTTPQITNPGGLWDEAESLYLPLRAKPNNSSLTMTFPSGMQIKFAHLEYEKNIYDWQGAQIPYIGFDELTHFSEKQFFYMLSRNRSGSGVPGYIRATTNPSPDSWVRRFIDWWIGEDGYPIPERDGIIRWFKRVNNEIVWYDEKPDGESKSVTFIAAKLDDNRILLEKDPSYRANLEALSYVDRMQLLKGNWNVKPSSGNFFKRDWFEIVDALPHDIRTSIRCWDKAASESKDADWTVGLRMEKSTSGGFFISDVKRIQGTPGKVKQLILNTASQDGKRVIVGLKQDPGQAGVYEKDDYIKALAGYLIKVEKESKDKQTRAKPLSAQCEAGNVKLLRGKWNDLFLDELVGFPDLDIDDQVDAASGAFNLLTQAPGQFSRGHVRKSKSKIVRNEDYDE